MMTRSIHTVTMPLTHITPEIRSLVQQLLDEHPHKPITEIVEFLAANGHVVPYSATRYLRASLRPDLVRESTVHSFREFIENALRQKPYTRTVDILTEARANGYKGGATPFFMLVKSLRVDDTWECLQCQTIFTRGSTKAEFCSASCKQIHHSSTRAAQPSNGLCYTCGEPNDGTRLCKRCRDRKNLSTAQSRRAARETAIEHYGGQCACVGCGETHYEFLAFDHIDGGGTKHRKQVGGHMETWIVKNGFPPTIRLLCHNCNCARGFHGYCPHEKEQK
jgi:hypothetical protein